MNNAINTASQRSSFITGLAWSFIVLAGFALLIALLQALVFGLLLPMADMGMVMNEIEKTNPMPPMVRFMFEHLFLISMIVLALSVLALVASIGLLKRHNWARLLFIWMMVFGILSHAAGLVMPFFMPAWLPSMSQDMPAQFGDYFNVIMKISMVFGAVVTLVTIGFFAWVLKRLLSDEIKREFLPM